MIKGFLEAAIDEQENKRIREEYDDEDEQEKRRIREEYDDEDEKEKKRIREEYDDEVLMRFLGKTSLLQPKKNYTVLKEEEIVQLQENDVLRASALLCIPKAAACFLLCHFNWDINELKDKWFADEDEVREKVGLFKKPAVLFEFNGSTTTCGMCFDECTISESNMIFSAACGHTFCRDCWTGYIRSSINEGPACLMLTCPEPSCKAAVGEDLISVFVSQQGHEYERYKRYLVRSYVEHSKEIKWCPSPGCNYAVKFDKVAALTYDVSCLCSNGFCWNCTEENHRPMDCRTAAKWILKNSGESVNEQRIRVNTKPCPKCKRPIDKSHGSNRMTCKAPCGFKFCWLCFKDISRIHCKCKEWCADAEVVVTKYLHKYIDFGERWEKFQTSKQKAVEEFYLVRIVDIPNLAFIQCKPETTYEFIKMAWQQIIECRQVLRWTYAYGYFIPENEHARRELFEFLQGQAESMLERLHQCAHKELQPFISADGPLKEFGEFRLKLVKLTMATEVF